MDINKLFLFNVLEYIFEDDCFVGVVIEVYNKHLDNKDYLEVRSPWGVPSVTGHISAVTMDILQKNKCSFIDLKRELINFYNCQRQK